VEAEAPHYFRYYGTTLLIVKSHHKS